MNEHPISKTLYKGNNLVRSHKMSSDFGDDLFTLWENFTNTAKSILGIEHFKVRYHNGKTVEDTQVEFYSENLECVGIMGPVSNTWTITELEDLIGNHYKDKE